MIAERIDSHPLALKALSAGADGMCADGMVSGARLARANCG